VSRLRVGMGQPYGVRPVQLATTDFDPMAVTGVVFHITKPTAVAGVTTTVAWTGTIGTQSTVSVQALYALNSDGSDLDFPGTWSCWLQWTVPGQTPGPRSEVFTFRVSAADAV
jgi:hypothetical protein